MVTEVCGQPVVDISLDDFGAIGEEKNRTAEMKKAAFFESFIVDYTHREGNTLFTVNNEEVKDSTRTRSDSVQINASKATSTLIKYRLSAFLIIDFTSLAHSPEMSKVCVILRQTFVWI